MSVVKNIAGGESGHLLKILGVTFGVAVSVGEAIGSGQPGPWTLRARADREAFIRRDLS